jgi:hypothetical protein
MGLNDISRKSTQVSE